MSASLRSMVLLLLVWALYACSPNEGELTRRAVAGELKAMRQLADSYLARGDNAKAVPWLKQAAILGDKRSVSDLDKLAAANNWDALAALAEYYGETGQTRLYMEYYYRAAKINPKHAASPAEFYLFGGTEKYGEEAPSIALQRGSELLRLAAKADSSGRYYLLLDRLANDGTIEASAEERAEWSDIATKATDRDFKLIVMSLKSSGCPKAIEYSKHFEKSATTTETPATRKGL